MSKFNQLYNIILQSIISQNKEYRRQVMQKAQYLTKQDKTTILKFLDSLNNNKLADLLVKFFAKGEFSYCGDPKINKIKQILEFNSSIDTQNYKGTSDQFIQKYYKNVQSKMEERSTRQAKSLDKIKQFSQKKQYSNGVVIYKVQQSKAGMNAVRKVVDAFWGKDANPWCLISRQSGWDAWHYWTNYTGYPKHIAFQNGKLLAFCDASSPTINWWNRLDEPSQRLQLLDGSYMETQKYKWTPEEQSKIFFLKHNLKLNEQTGRYDCQEEMEIFDSQLVNGQIPVPIGTVDGYFKIRDCWSLSTLVNGPVRVRGNFYADHCPDLKNLEGAPEVVFGNFVIDNCHGLTSLVGAPKAVSEFNCANCISLSSLEGLTPKIQNNLFIYDCTNLTSLVGCPEELDGTFDCSDCYSLDSLSGGPKKVWKDYNCSNCKGVATLQGGPEYVGWEFNCYNMDNLSSLIGSPEYVGSHYCASQCSNLKNLQGITKDIRGDLYLNHCYNLQSLEGLQNTKLGGKIHCGHTHIDITDEDRKKWNIVDKCGY